MIIINIVMSIKLYITHHIRKITDFKHFLKHNAFTLSGFWLIPFHILIFGVFKNVVPMFSIEKKIFIYRQV